MKLSGNGYTNKSLGNLSDLQIDSNGNLWFVNNNWYISSLYRYNIDTKKILSFTEFKNQDGLSIENINYVSCTVEDKDGNIWVGTQQGPLLLEKGQVEASSPVFTQVKVPRNDGTNYADYLMTGIGITAICIDGGGRKWFGTDNNGVYLISEDNLTQIQHFTTDNSKLLSNHVTSIAINNNTGEVFFGTGNGLCSYISDATTPVDKMTKDDVYAYPNPVEAGYTGLITVVGLSYDADVKILTSNGKLVAQGRSNGGTFTWNGCDQQGRRVASGVYMVATATSNGDKGVVCKIAIIN
jgi:streptogramin lyase